MRVFWKYREWLRRCGYLIHRAKFTEIIENESQFHLEMRISELEADGVSPAQASAQPSPPQALAGRHGYGGRLPKFCEGCRP